MTDRLHHRERQTWQHALVRTHWSLRPGFTLLEVLLCLGLIVVLIGAMSVFLLDIVQRRASLARGARDIQSAGAFFERIEADMLAGLAGGPGMGAGVKGTATSLRLLTRGVDLSSDRVIDAGDLQGSEFVFNPGVCILTAQRLSGLNSLAGSGGGADPEVLSDRFERVRFRYYDGRAWRDEFDSLSEGTLPVAVEVNVWVTSVGNERAVVRRGLPAGVASVGASEAVGASGEESKANTDTRAPSGVATDPNNAIEIERGPPARRRVIVVPDGPDA